MRTIKYAVLLLTIILFLSSCSHNQFDVDIDPIQVNIPIKRLDKDLFALNIDSLPTQLPAVNEKYGRFWLLYNYQILRLGNPHDSLYPLYLKKFLTDPTIQEVHNEEAKQFANIRFLQKDLDLAFRYFKYYFPQHTTPEVITYISGFNQSVVTDSALVGISLDKYLGKNCKFYEYLEVPKYLRRRMVKQKIIVDVMEAYGRMEFDDDLFGKNLLQNMIYEGKIQYFLSATLPFVPDSLKLGYDSRQMKWANDFEKDMWTYLIEKKLLFEHKNILIRNMIGEAPFTKAFGNKSAPRAAVFIGKKIVESYMKHHPEKTLKDLMLQTDADLILRESQYNP